MQDTFFSDDPQDETLSQSDEDRREVLRRQGGGGTFADSLEIPGYELIRPLGRGSYGEVWLALAANTRREVAVKIFTRRRGIDWELLRREVEKMASVATERRVVQLLEVGWEGEHPYFVMEYLPGGSLAEYLDRGRLDPEQALAFFRQIAEALVFLHGKAVLHCDLKPANVLLDGHGGIRLGDLGQARARYERGAVAGTLFYMAPEQAVMGSQPDVRSDLYSLGAILYALLTGRPPHASAEASRELASSSTVSDRLERYRQLLLTAKSPLENPSLARLDKDLLGILRRCLSTDPGERFENAQQVLNAVDRRQHRRQQRPLLVFGLAAPLLIFTVLAAVGFGTFDTTVSSAREALLQQASAANLATAKVAAAAVDYNLSAVERRVQREAGRAELRELLANDLPTRLDAASLGEIQAYADDLYETYQRRHFFSWVVADRKGTALARAPFDPRVVGSSYGYREWFSGRVESLQGDLPDRQEPRSEVGLTLAFRSTADGEPVLVSVAAPIYAGDTDEGVSGVLAATLHLETFQEWLSGAEFGSRNGDASRRETRDGACPERMVLLLHRGQLVRHPCPSVEGEQLPILGYLEGKIAAQIRQSGDLAMLQFEDPLRPGVDLIAAATRLENHAGWTALVLQERSRALAPLRRLAQSVRRLAWIGTAVGLAMVLGLYALLFRVIRPA